MTAPDYAQPVTARTAPSAPIVDARLGGIDYTPAPEAAAASAWLERLRAERAARDTTAAIPPGLLIGLSNPPGRRIELLEPTP